MSMTIWTNHGFRPDALELFQKGLAAVGHRLVHSPKSSASVLAAGAADPSMNGADVAFGQPDIGDTVRLTGVRWVALSTAGYTRYDTPEFRAAMTGRGTLVTNSSAVFADPCAQQMLAAMLALARNLPSQLRNQDGPREWRYLGDRFTASVLTGQNFLLLGFGAIGKRMAELLAPFGGQVTAYRRTPRGDEGVALVNDAGLPAAFAAADHVVNLLPDSPATKFFMNTARFAAMKPGARFYNVGRGTTVDQDALIAALKSGRLNAAYLDVMEPEPLPPAHPLWSAPNCYITCHLGGGTGDQDVKLVKQFLENLRRFEKGEVLIDRII
ncbi:MAG: D-2-hydroxyacid dehydrogenase [Opitutaceae bacterium]|nr:D-2-hydroxyacid dehydrogenase [Opitutaceae bacterium]